MEKERRIKQAFALAREAYGEIGVDVDLAMALMDRTPISVHCWQTDDVAGCEVPDSKLSGGGIQATGNYPGRAGNLAEIRQDLEKVLSLVPGRHRVNLHACYGDFGGASVDRDEIGIEHFHSWIDWAKHLGIGMDFNCTLFSHPRAESGFTLSSKNTGIRDFWIEHVKRSREVAAHIGEELGSPCIHNIWIPDGAKDLTVDRFTHRALLKSSLDAILQKKV